AVGIAQHRGGLATDMLSLSRKSVVAAFAPELDLTFAWSPADGRQSDFVDETTAESHGHDWSLKAFLCWGGCGRFTVTDFGDEVSSFELDNPDADSIYVVDGEVYDEGQSVA